MIHKLIKPLFNLSMTTRIAFVLAMWSATVLLLLSMIGVIDDGHTTTIEYRTQLAEMYAVSCSQLASKGDINDAAVLLNSLARRDQNVISCGIRNNEDQVLVATSQHKQVWHEHTQRSDFNKIEVPLFQKDQQIAKIEIAFKSPVASGMVGFLLTPPVRITILACVLNLIGFAILLNRCFRQFDPSQVVPHRVRTALDTLAEGVLVLDNDNQIMFANEKICRALHEPSRQLQGRNITSLPWQRTPKKSNNELVLDSVEKVLEVDGQQPRHFKLNQSPITDEAGVRRGMLLSLDDITEIREQHGKLLSAMERLANSKKEIAEKNEELLTLATRDALTNCFNRRAFIETLEKTWNASQRYNHPLSCIMIDVDYFKNVNDQHGHAAGDEVLKRVANVFMDNARSSDIVCRYGGEEFCILLPNVDIAGAQIAAERYRRLVSEIEFDNLSITISLGCSDRSFGADIPEKMLDQADQALYIAKRNGRNRVCRFDQLEEEVASV